MAIDPSAKYYGGQAAGRKTAPTQYTQAAPTGQEVPQGSPVTEAPKPVSIPEAEAPVSTVSATTGEQKADVTPAQEDVLVIDPNKMLRMPDGEVISYAELSKRQMRHEKYISGMTALDRDKKALDAKMRENQSQETLINAIARNPKLKAAAEYALDGKQEDEALRLIGFMPASQQAQNAQPVGMPIGIPDPPDPSLPDYEEHYATWYNTQYKPAMMQAAAKQQVDPVIAQLSNRLAALEAEKQQNEQLGAQAEQLIANNGAVLETWTTHFKRITGTDYNTLTPEQRIEAERSVAAALQERGINPYNSASLAQRPLSEQEIYDAVYQANSKPVNSFFRDSETTKVALAKPRVMTKEPISGNPAGTTNSPGTRGQQDRFASPVDRTMNRYFS